MQIFLKKKELGIEAGNLAAVADKAAAKLGLDATGMAIAQKLDAAMTALGGSSAARV